MASGTAPLPLATSSPTHRRRPRGLCAPRHAPQAPRPLRLAAGPGSASSVAHQRLTWGSAGRFTRRIDAIAAGTRTTWSWHPDNQGGLGFEREVPPAGSAQNRHYVSAAGAVIAVIVTEGTLPALAANQTAPNYVGTIAAAKLQYWHRDHLGSTIATTDHAGAVTARYAYDPFGRRRHTDGSENAAGSLVVDWAPGAAAGTDCGYTGHEHLDDAGVVHMNGRIYDPLIARFMQADPLVQNPANLQGYDRYAYCYNSPLVCTDPSGYASLSKLWKKIRPFVAIAVAIYLGPGGMAWGAESMFAIRRKRRITAACH